MSKSQPTNKAEYNENGRCIHIKRSSGFCIRRRCCGPCHAGQEPLNFEEMREEYEEERRE